MDDKDAEIMERRASPESLHAADLDACDFCGGQYDENLQEQRDEIMALESIYSADTEDILEIVSSPDEKGNGLFNLQISVRVKLDGNKITMNVWQDCTEAEKEEEGGACAQARPPTIDKGVQFSRSDSGQRWLGSFQVSHLLPLNLQLVLPPTYPSHCSPHFSLWGAWLSAGHLSALCGQLDQLWQASPGLPIIFSWVDWLESNTLSHLGITDSLVLVPGAAAEDADPRAIAEFSGVSTITQMLRYNRHQEDVTFYQSEQECQVCFDQKPGTEFHRMADCPHHFCHPCMTDYCNMHVSEGTVERLKCPDMECEEAVPPGVVLSVLPEELGQRWERLVLQRSLDSMEDVVWCPRCRSVVIKEEGEQLQLAVCTVCYFAFCTQCQEAWHQGQGCATAENKLEDLKERQNRKDISNEERKRLQELEARLKEERSTTLLLHNKNLRKCPKCKVSVEKNGGCNKMTCRCGQSFCWLCGQAIKNYSHFQSSGCGLMNQAAIVIQPVRLPPVRDLLNQVRLNMDPNRERDVCFCPGCKLRNLRDDRNNHMRCWNCKMQFCFLCGQRLQKDIPTHFRPPSLCKQHS